MRLSDRAQAVLVLSLFIYIHAYIYKDVIYIYISRDIYIYGRCRSGGPEGLFGVFYGKPGTGSLAAYIRLGDSVLTTQKRKWGNSILTAQKRRRGNSTLTAQRRFAVWATVYPVQSICKIRVGGP